MPEPWREQQMLKSMNELVGRIDHLTETDALELERLVGSISELKAPSARAGSQVVRTLNAALKQMYGLNHPGVTAPLTRTQVAATEALVNMAKRGLLTDDTITEAAKSNWVVGASLVKNAKPYAGLQQQILSLVETAPIASMTKFENPRAVVNQSGFDQLTDVLARIDLNDKRAMDRLKVLVQNPRYMYRAASLMIARPEAFQKVGIRLGQEFIEPMNGPMETVIQEKLVDRAMRLGEHNEAKRSEISFEVRKTKYAAMRSGLSDAISTSLKKVTSNRVTETTAPQIQRALDLAAVYEVPDRQAIAIRLTRAGLMGGVKADEPYLASAVRQYALQALPDEGGKEVQAAIIAMFDDPELFTPSAAVRKLERMELAPESKELLAAKIRELEANGVNLRRHFSIEIAQETNLRRRAMRAIEATGGAVSCAPGFADLARGRHLKRVK